LKAHNQCLLNGVQYIIGKNRWIDHLVSLIDNTLGAKMEAHCDTFIVSPPSLTPGSFGVFLLLAAISSPNWIQPYFAWFTYPPLYITRPTADPPPLLHLLNFFHSENSIILPQLFSW
jgi:hypothetical protein